MQRSAARLLRWLSSFGPQSVTFGVNVFLTTTMISENWTPRSKRCWKVGSGIPVVRCGASCENSCVQLATGRHRLKSRLRNTARSRLTFATLGSRAHCRKRCLGQATGATRYASICKNVRRGVAQGRERRLHSVGGVSSERRRGGAGTEGRGGGGRVLLMGYARKARRCVGRVSGRSAQHDKQESGELARRDVC